MQAQLPCLLWYFVLGSYSVGRSWPHTALPPHPYRTMRAGSARPTNICATERTNPAQSSVSNKAAPKTRTTPFVLGKQLGKH